jgi:hypothetical protein
MSDNERRGVERQARRGAYNRRVARGAENLERELLLAGMPRSAGAGEAEFFCACGRPDCDELLVLTLDEHRFVREKPYRFLVARGHATDTDEVIFSTDEYEVVELKPAYRQIAAEIVGS